MSSSTSLPHPKTSSRKENPRPFFAAGFPPDPGAGPRGAQPGARMPGSLPNRGGGGDAPADLVGEPPSSARRFRSDCVGSHAVAASTQARHESEYAIPTCGCSMLATVEPSAKSQAKHPMEIATCAHVRGRVGATRRCHAERSFASKERRLHTSASMCRHVSYVS